MGCGRLRIGRRVRNRASGVSRRRHPLVAVSLLVMATASSGCYGYFTTAPGTLHPGEQVRLVLDDAVAPRLATPTLTGERSLDGDFVSLDPDSLRLSVWIGEGYEGTGFSNVHKTVSIPRSGVQLVEERKLSKVRTGLLVAGAAVAIGVAISNIHFLRNPNATQSGGTPNPPPGSGAHVGIPVSWILHAISW